MLEPGTQLGPYEITAPIGAGGMGEVYKARDTRLDRIVAIKILPEHLAGSPERRTRFEREARAVSSLNHPHICTLHDIGSDNGIDFIVMEYLEGESLAERLRKGPLSFDQALRCGREIAEALDKAHRQGVVHRDLKPGNVMITKSGAVLLDFGLAKRTGLSEDASDGSDSAQPTQAKDLTDEGAVLGTFQYMAPEQLEGGDIDARTDIFAFGAVLYEMLTGKKAFSGKSQASLIGAILKDDPPSLSSLQPTSPPELDRVLRKCLAKDPGARWGSAHDVSVLLSWVHNDKRPKSSVREPSRQIAWILAALLGWGVAVGGWILGTSSEVQENPLLRFSVDASGAGLNLSSGGPVIAVSPNGATVVFATAERFDIAPSPLHARDLDSLELRSLPGTDGGQGPAFSPDGEWIAYHSDPDRTIKKVRLAGGPPQTICDIEANSIRGITWGENGFIYFTQQPAGIFRVAADGGDPELVLAPEAEQDVKNHRLPSLLPGDQHLLFVTGYASMDSYDQATISVLSIETGDQKILIEGGSRPKYTETGHIVFTRDGAILAAPFDLDRLELTDRPQTVASGVVTSHAWGTGQFDLSRTGTLVYLPGAPDAYYPDLTWVERDGKSEPFDLVSRDFRQVSFSPDGRKVALSESKGNDDIWSYDIQRGTLTRVTNRWDNAGPTWAPDGQSIMYNSTHPGSGTVRRADDGSGPEEIIRRNSAKDFDALGSISPDGRHLLYANSGDVWLLSLDEDRNPEVVIASEFEEANAKFSPDGKWIAYDSNESGRVEVYVQPFKGTQRRTLISSGGGQKPEWRRDGGELFFFGENALQSVPVRTDPDFKAGTPTKLLERPNLLDYDVSPDGKRFLVIETRTDSIPTKIHVVVNWHHELNRLVPPN